MKKSDVSKKVAVKRFLSDAIICHRQIAFGLFVILLLIFSTIPLPNTTTVRADEPPPAYNVNLDTYYATIQEAIDDAEPDNTIEVSSGTYAEQLLIEGTDKNNITLSGSIDGNGAPTSIINLSSFDSAYGVRIINVEGITIKNFKVHGSLSHGINTTQTNGITIDNVVAFSNAFDGIRVRSSIDATIRNCVSINNNENGITFSSYGYIFNNTVNNNLKKGIYIDGYAAASATGVTGEVMISGNEVFSNGGYDTDSRVGGIVVYGAKHTPALIRVQIEENVIFDNFGPGVLLYKVNHNGSSKSFPADPSSESILRKNKIYANKDFHATNFERPGDGIVIYLSHHITIETNEIYDSVAAVRITNRHNYQSYGPTTNITVLTNELYGNNYSVFVNGGTNYKVETTVIHYNTFYDNLNGLLNLQNFDEVVDATLNWWGHSSGPSGIGSGSGDPVSENIEFMPWLDAPSAYELTVTIEGGGSITKNPDATSYYLNTEVELTPIADSGWFFYEWGGPDANQLVDVGNGSWIILMNNDTIVTAKFAKEDVPVVRTRTGTTNTNTQYTDTLAPNLTLLSPEIASSISDARPIIIISYEDQSGIDIDSIEFILDSIDRTYSGTYNSSQFIYIPVTPLSDGIHTITFSVADNVGNVNRETWAFSIVSDDTLVIGTSYSVIKGERKEMDLSREDHVIHGISMIATANLSNVKTICRLLTQKPSDAIVLDNLVYLYLSIETNVDDLHIDSLIISFKVEKEWLIRNNIDEEKVTLLRYNNTQWQQVSTTKTFQDESYVYYEATTPRFSTFAISGEQIEKTPEAPVFWLFVIFGIITVVVISFILSWKKTADKKV